MFRISYTAALLLAAQAATAQAPAARKEADRFFSEGDHYRAAVKYEQYLGFRKSTGAAYVPYSPQRTGTRAGSADRPEALRRLAECYFHLRDYAQAARYYGLAGDAALTPADRLHYAISLRATGQPAAAETMLGALQSDPAAASLAPRVRSELAALAFSRNQASNPETALFSVGKLPGAANKGSGNYAAAVAGPDLYFTSSRRDSTKGEVPAWNRLYRTSVTDTASDAQVLPLAVPGATDIGLASFSADGSLLVFTAWQRSGGKNVATIYSSKLEAGKWSAPAALGESVNAPGSSNAQPYFVTTGDKNGLLFSSDRAGGSGGLDIWFAPMDAQGRFGTAQNLGSDINTAGDEAAPFFHAGSRTLVFASNGHVGMGGFDLFASTLGTAAFEKPRNLGAPVNSVKDDSYFYSASADSLFRNAYLSSDRASDCCLELFAISKTYAPRSFRRFVTGTITDCNGSTRLPAAQVTVGTRSVQANGEGVYRIELEAAQEGSIGVQASVNSYRPESKTLQLTTVSNDTTYTVDICLNNRRRQWEPVLFDFDKDTLTVAAKAQLDLVAQDLDADATLRVQVGGYTDGFGAEGYNNDLAQRRAESVRKYLVGKGIPESRLDPKGFGECCPVAPERVGGKDAPDARRLNRRVELKVY